MLTVESSTFATLTIGACTRPLQCGQTLPALDTAFQVSAVSGCNTIPF